MQAAQTFQNKLITYETGDSPATTVHAIPLGSSEFT